MAEIVKGFFFDLDGTLVNTHEANFRAYKQAIEAVAGVAVDEEVLKDRIKQGESSSVFIPATVRSVTPSQVAQIQEMKKKYYPAHLDKSEFNEFLSGFLAQMSEHYITALITTATRQSAEAVLAVHNITHYFDFCIYGEDVEFTKPHPEAYQRALVRAGLSADEVIAFEDSAIGVKSALGAGIKTVQIRKFHDA